MATNPHTVSVSEAESGLSQLIERVLAGEEIVIARDREPVVRLVREEAPRKASRIGTMKGRMADIGDEAMAPLSDEYLGLDLWSDKPL